MFGSAPSAQNILLLPLVIEKLLNFLSSRPQVSRLAWPFSCLISARGEILFAEMTRRISPDCYIWSENSYFGQTAAPEKMMVMRSLVCGFPILTRPHLCEKSSHRPKHTREREREEDLWIRARYLDKVAAVPRNYIPWQPQPEREKRFSLVRSSRRRIQTLFLLARRNTHRGANASSLAALVHLFVWLLPLCWRRVQTGTCQNPKARQHTHLCLFANWLALVQN